MRSKYTHVEEETFNVQEPEIDELITNVVESFIELLNKIEECRDSVQEEVESGITSRVYGYISQETFNNIDILSTHHYIEHSEVEECNLVQIDSNSIVVSIKGYLEVVQDYGSSSDRASGEGATINSTFPFKGTVRISAYKIPEDFEIEIDELEVDTDSWYE
ncbi:hypothetical protein LZG74_17735 [Dyadobacter sp. CY327]|uniref:pPIWI-associating nuclease domain-containing protein n=1 Tax=Dyadobacter sp. CY327 TaxID=2907301 RepID=UPI001F3E64DA|nr:hypothetical protein [Dyadobacter sp. CY327]MCE7072163.1 hypothetical protein [Dyadobacter sp. CY327]